jgi:hypothetical protein
LGDFVSVGGFWAVAENAEITKSAISVINACFPSIPAGLNVSSSMPGSTAPLPSHVAAEILFVEARASFYPSLASQATKNRQG